MEMVSTSFMQEGLAMAVDEIVFNRKQPQKGVEGFADDLCRQRMGEMPKSLNECINMDGFSSYPNEVILPFTASFSKYLLQRYGVGKYKEMYTKLKETNDPKENVQLIEDVYNVGEADLLQSWEKNLSQMIPE